SVPLQQPNISLTSPNGGLVWGPEGAEVTRGYSFVLTCSINSNYHEGRFLLIFSGSNITNTKPAVNLSASFNFPVAEYEHEGNYSCVYEVTLSGRDSLESPETALVIVIIKLPLQQPNISLTSPNGGLVWGPEGAEVTRGYSFVLTCSINSNYHEGRFLLTFSGSNITNTKSAVNLSASFKFPVAEYEHEGNYSCVYEVTLSRLNFSSPETAPITVTIKFPLLLLVSSVAVGSLLLFLLVLLVACLVCRRRQRAKHPITQAVKEPSIKEQVTVAEEEDSDDYEQPDNEDHDYEDIVIDANYIIMEEVTVEDNREEEEEDIHSDDDYDYENVEHITQPLDIVDVVTKFRHKMEFMFCDSYLPGVFNVFQA
ncbi:uncharacterized protein LOC128378678, partial [Scomber japonicus]|uniref:uncharacterized protein LOC128378678 n=1 Tax=Scomber japonicus TaxID=13676 RepID=UPI002305109E